MKKVSLTLIACLLLVTGCSGSKEQHSHGQATAPVLTYEIGSNDWSVITAYSPKEKVLEAYQFAVEHPEVLDYMPCYCGCFEEDGHINNTHCFVQKVEGNTAILDTMGFG